MAPAGLSTVTVSESAPATSCTSSPRTSATSRMMHVRITDLNPVRETSTVYGPVGNSPNEYDPDPFVIVERLKPVFSFLTVTVAPGTTAPVLSVTVPRRLAVILWAEDGAANATRRIVKEIILRIGRCLPSFGDEFCEVTLAS